MTEKEKMLETLFERGIFADIVPSKDALIKKITGNNPFSIYWGIDATAQHIHLGHLQNLLILEDLRKMGVAVHLLFGGFTTRIGDPEGKKNTRKKIPVREIKSNIRNFKKQVRPFLKTGLFSGTKVVDNADWTLPMRAEKVLEIASTTTIQQLLDRDSFQKRIQEGSPLYVHEVLYPLFQGYDSVAMNIDAELCGTDQLFNALRGRDLVRHYCGKEKIVLTTHLIQDKETGVMMSKSMGTGVSVIPNDPDAMFGSIMSLSDGFIEPLYRGATRVPMDTVYTQLERTKGDAREKKEVKMDLAQTIITMMSGEREAHSARKRFTQQFSNKTAHKNTPRITLKNPTPLVDILMEREIASSRSQAKRLILQGGVYVDDVKVNDIQMTVSPKTHTLIRSGIHMVQIEP